MENQFADQYRQKITLLNFVSKLLPFIVRIHYVGYYVIKGLRMIRPRSGNNTSWGLTLEHSAKKYADCTAVKSSEGCLTYAELNRKANQFAHFLKTRAVTKGDTVTLCVDTRPELLVLFCGCAKIGAVCAMINVNQRGDSLSHSFNLNKGKVIVIGEECYDIFKQAQAMIDTRGADLCFIRDPLRNALNMPNDITDLLQKMPTGNPAETKQVTLKDRLAYIYTSGTTGGLPKAAVITNQRAISGMFWWGRIVTSVKSSHTIYIPLPFFHTNAITTGWPPALFSGASVAIRRKFSASGFLDDVKRFKATHFVYIGEVCRYLMAQPDMPGQDATTLKFVYGNGLRPDIWTSFKNRYGLKKIYEFYGAADGVGVFTNILNFEFAVGMSLTAYAIVKYDVENESLIRNKNGGVIKVKKGEPGLLIMQISTKTPFDGYSDKKKTEEKIVRNAFKKDDMWFNTGDMLRDMGYRQLQFVDRLGDTFRWKGENVATAEVEKALLSFPDVKSAVAYGVSMPSGEGKAGMAAIIKNEAQDIDFCALPDHLNSVLPKYALPLFIRLVNELEQTATHKFKKNDLKNEGYDPNKTGPDVYVLLPGKNSYTPLTNVIYQEIIDGKYRF